MSKAIRLCKKWSHLSALGWGLHLVSQPAAAGVVGARRSAWDSPAASSARRAAKKSAEAEPEQHSFWFSFGFLLVFFWFSSGFPEVSNLRKPQENLRKTIRKPKKTLGLFPFITDYGRFPDFAGRVVESGPGIPSKLHFEKRKDLTVGTSPGLKFLESFHKTDFMNPSPRRIHRIHFSHA